VSAGTPPRDGEPLSAERSDAEPSTATAAQLCIVVVVALVLTVGAFAVFLPQDRSVAWSIVVVATFSVIVALVLALRRRPRLRGILLLSIALGFLAASLLATLVGASPQLLAAIFAGGAIVGTAVVAMPVSKAALGDWLPAIAPSEPPRS
jgi:MFS family permease